jgi:predicted Zn-dependent protease
LQSTCYASVFSSVIEWILVEIFTLKEDGNIMATRFEQAVAYIRAGETEKGRQLLIEVLKQSPQDENAWLWMSRCVTDPERKRYCFDRVLKINSQNQHAIEGLRRLNRAGPATMQPEAV